MEDEHPLDTNKEEETKPEEKPVEEKPAEPKPVEPKPVEEKPIKPKKQILWPVLTAIFALLFIISLFTHGFHFGGVETMTGAATGELTAVILTDERCGEACDTTGLITNLKSLFPNLVVNELDYSSKQGKKIYEDNALQFLPAVLFTKDVENTPGYQQISRFIEPAGEYISLRIGAEFDPTAEVCDNGIDDTGNGKIDCEDPYCKGKLVCREEIPQKLDLFVMSQCPYGTMALNAMEEVLENFGDDIDFDVHYIASENEDGTFRALHGQPEVDENIRQLCAKKYYGVDYKYMDYIWCRNKDIQSEEWENCAFKAEMSTDKIKTCAEGGEGKKLHSKDIKIAQGLGFGASPTWLANNKYTFGGVDAETIRQNFCDYNPDLEGCSATLSTAENVAEGQC